MLLLNCSLNELIGILDYIQDDNELKDFRDWLLADGSDYLTPAQRAILSRGGYDDDVQHVLEDVARNPSIDHVWAIAHRVRASITDYPESVDRLIHDVQSIPLDKLISDVYINDDMTRMCLIGHVAVMNGVPKEDLASVENGDLEEDGIVQRIAEIYHLDPKLMYTIVSDFDRYVKLYGMPERHDDLVRLIYEAVRDYNEHIQDH